MALPAQQPDGQAVPRPPPRTRQDSHGMCTACALLHAHCTRTACTPHPHCMRTARARTACASYMTRPCALHAPYMRLACTTPALRLYHACTTPAPCRCYTTSRAARSRSPSLIGSSPRSPGARSSRPKVGPLVITPLHAHASGARRSTPHAQHHMHACTHVQAGSPRALRRSGQSSCTLLSTRSCASGGSS